MRIRVAPTDTLASVAGRLHDQFIQDAPHERLGMTKIIRDCTGWPDGQDFGWRTAFQQDDGGGGQGADEGAGEDFRFLAQRSDFSVHQGPMLPRPRPEIYATPNVRTGRLVFSFEGNRKLIDESTARDVVAKVRDMLMNM